jgi:Fe-S-cluster containining protein
MLVRKMGDLSLIKYRIPCKSKCCKVGKFFGSPILDYKEAKKIKDYVKEIKLKSGKTYFILKEGKKGQDCIFLKDGKCKIEKNKPLDCLCYPVKAIYSKDKIVYVLDKACPVSKGLDKNFIKDSKKVALKSIKRFDKETYNHWLKNNVGWVRKTSGRLV